MRPFARALRPVAVCIGVLGVMLAGLGCRSAILAIPASPGAQENRLQYAGLERSYWVVAAAGEPSRPVVLALHGGGGTAAAMCRMRGGLQDLARQGAYILVCPQGVENHWNDGRQITRWRAHTENIDDVGFLAAVIEDVAKDHSVDLQRVFATGISNGGQMSYRLACERGDLVRAIAPVAASMAETLECAPARPVSVAILNGVADPLVPYGGGWIGFGGDRLGRVIATEEAWRRWAELNQCSGEPDQVWLPDRSPDDGTRTQLLSRSGCAEGTQVLLYRIEGGGHTWPSGPQYLPEWVVGRVSQDLDGSQLIWDFFEAQPVEAERELTTPGGHLVTANGFRERLQPRSESRRLERRSRFLSTAAIRQAWR